MKKASGRFKGREGKYLGPVLVQYDKWILLERLPKICFAQEWWGWILAVINAK